MILMVDVRMVIIVLILVMDLMFDLGTNSRVGGGFGAEHDDGCDDEEENDKDDDHDDGDVWWWTVMDGDAGVDELASQFGRILYIS